jgi:hypothetical protein
MVSWHVNAVFTALPTRLTSPSIRSLTPGLFCACLVGTLLITLEFLIRYRVPLDHKLFNVVRLDILLSVAFLLEWLLAEACYIDYYISSDTFKHSQYAEALKEEDARRYDTLNTVHSIRQIVAIFFALAQGIMALYIAYLWLRAYRRKATRG